MSNILFRVSASFPMMFKEAYRLSNPQGFLFIPFAASLLTYSTLCWIAFIHLSHQFLKI